MKVNVRVVFFFFFNVEMLNACVTKIRNRTLCNINFFLMLKIFKSYLNNAFNVLSDQNLSSFIIALLFNSFGHYRVIPYFKFFAFVFPTHWNDVLFLSHFVCSLFHFEMSQNIVLFLKIKIINLLIFILYPINLLIQFFDKFI